MRKQIRPPAPFPFPEKSEDWNQAWVAKRTETPNASFSWYTFQKKDARAYALPSLRDMNQSHCSFCDCYPMADRSEETIEHFRPKTLFPHLAYAWENLYYCCSQCQKKDWDENLIRPDCDEYSFFKYFEFDYVTGEILPNRVAVELDRKRAEITIERFRLNSVDRLKTRRLELRRWVREKEHGPIDEYGFRDFIEVYTNAQTP